MEAEKPTENVLPTTSKLEIKMSKTTPTKLKELLETGLLQGLRVRYIRGSRVIFIELLLNLLAICSTMMD